MIKKIVATQRKKLADYIKKDSDVDHEYLNVISAYENSEDEINNSNIRYNIISETCEIVERNKFLKTVCSNEYDVEYFQCTHSVDTYQIGYGRYGHNDYTLFNKTCQNDTFFYQVCGATNDTIITNSDGILCKFYICSNAKRYYNITINYISDSINESNH